MSDIIKEYRLESGKVLRIYQDESPESPRELENLGVMFCSHRRYNLGDKKEDCYNLNTDDFDNWNDMEKWINGKLDSSVCLPIFMYDHSGIAIKTTPFGDRWDSGQIGFIFVTKEDVKKEWKVKKISKKLKKRITEILENEVKTYDQYLQGDIYMFKVKKVDTETGEEETEDSCGGFYGDNIKENGMLEYIDDIILEYD